MEDFNAEYIAMGLRDYAWFQFEAAKAAGIMARAKPLQALLAEIEKRVNRRILANVAAQTVEMEADEALRKQVEDQIEREPLAMFMSGKLQIEGEMSFALAMQPLFF